MKNIIIYNLGKKYKRYPNQWSRLVEWLSGKRYLKHEERWVLRGISFEIKQGEAVGIVGQNGAGKSTLLKILTGTTQPNQGNVQIEGRVAALLELGMGFHPDFTGRENAIMACRMAGLGRDEIKKYLPEIESFSELGDYMEQPLRVYSTGMQMRLAFTSVTVIRPDILIVDEALSVGDAYFSQKCIHRIRSFQEKGTTLIFVSHNPGSIKSLCNRAILIDEGILIKDGAPDAVLDYYNAIIAKKNKDEEIKQIENKFGRISTRSGSGDACILNVDLFDESGKSVRVFQVGDIAKIECNIKCELYIEDLTVGFIIRDCLGNDVFGTNTYYLKVGRQNYKAGENLVTVFTLPLNLGSGNYSLCTAVHSHETHLENNYDWWDQCLVFQVIPSNSFSFIGIASLPVEVAITKEGK